MSIDDFGPIREKAEALLGSRYSPEDALKDADLPQILHELQVHQIELELQNQELRDAQTQLLEAQRKYFHLYDFAPSGYITLSSGGIVTDANLKAAELFNLDRNYLIGRPVLAYVHVDGHEALLRYIDAAVQGRKLPLRPLDVLLLPRGCDPLPVQLDARLSGDEAKPALRVIITDISALKALQTALETSEAQLRQVLQHAPLPMMLHDERGNVLLLNATWQRITGYGADEITTVADWDALVSASAWPGQRPLPALNGRDELVPTRAGASRVWEMRTVTLGADRSGRQLTLRVAIDVTDERQATAVLRQQTLELERSNDDLQQFAYVVSHDLKEPLRMVSSFLQLIGQRLKHVDDPALDEYIHYASDGAERMRALLDGLLAYSRVQSRGNPFSPVDLTDVVDGVLRSLKQQIDEAGAEIVVAGDLPQAYADRTQVYQALLNLIGNALKYRAESPPRVEVSASKAGRFWQLAVSDNGIGIAPKDHERIFDVFTRLHTVEEYDGTGAGLAIVKRIVTRHGGEVWVRSALGEGATFYFTLPEVPNGHASG